MIYTMERRHYFGSGSMESRWEVHEYSHRCQSGDLPEGKLVYSCKAKKEASAYCKANGIEPQPRYNAAKTDAERRAVLDRQTVQGLWWAIGFVSKIPAVCMSEKELNHAIRLTRFRGAVCPVFRA